MDIPRLEIIYKQNINILSSKVSLFTVKINIPIPFTILGLDTGTVHIGLSVLQSKEIILYEIETERRTSTDQRIQYMWDFLDAIGIYPTKFIIEGASYADKYRQVELQDIRAGAVSWILKIFPRALYISEIVPPLTIRKVVFGSAKIKNPWVEQGIPDNAAAALACALFPIMKEKGKQT